MRLATSRSDTLPSRAKKKHKPIINDVDAPLSNKKYKHITVRLATNTTNNSEITQSNEVMNDDSSYETDSDEYSITSLCNSVIDIDKCKKNFAKFNTKPDKPKNDDCEFIHEETCSNSRSLEFFHNIFKKISFR